MDTDLENCKRMLERARIGFHVSPVQTVAGYTMLETIRLHFVFNCKGELVEMTHKDNPA